MMTPEERERQLQVVQDKLECLRWERQWFVEDLAPGSHPMPGWPPPVKP